MIRLKILTNRPNKIKSVSLFFKGLFNIKITTKEMGIIRPTCLDKVAIIENKNAIIKQFKFLFFKNERKKKIDINESIKKKTSVINVRLNKQNRGLKARKEVLIILIDSLLVKNDKIL